MLIITIFIDVKNPEVNKDELWNETQRQAVYRAMCQNENKDVNQIHIEIREYVDTWCRGKLLDFRFEHTSDDKSPIDETVASARKLFDLLKQECAPLGLSVSWAEGV